MRLVQRQAELEEICTRLRAAPPLAFDTEFIRERRYWPQLCLVQVRGEDGTEALLDPFELNLKPFLDLVQDESIVKIVHGAQQDLEILFDNLGCATHGIFDTQIAAAFLGFGHQAGYADLVHRVVKGPPISKGSQFSDWAARPLTPQQLEYAIADVRHLHPLYEALHRDLEKRGRLAWAETEFRRLEARTREEIPADRLYLRLNASGLNRRQLGALRELAATRDELSRAVDRPPVSILPDVAMLQLARHPPASAQAMRSMRGVPPSVAGHADALLAALRRAAQTPDDQLPPTSPDDRPDARIRGVVGLMNALAQIRSAEFDVSRTYLAPTDQLNELADWWLKHRDGEDPPAIPLLSDWREQLLGKELLDLLRGRIELSVHPPSRRGNGSIVRSSPRKVSPEGTPAPGSEE